LWAFFATAAMPVAGGLALAPAPTLDARFALPLGDLPGPFLPPCAAPSSPSVGGVGSKEQRRQHLRQGSWVNGDTRCRAILTHAQQALY
jgi:hypothetical protein